MARLQNVMARARTLARVWIPKLLKALLALSLLLLGAISFVALVVLKRQGDLPPLGPQAGGLLALGIFAAVLVALWWVPRRQARAAASEMTAGERAILEDTFRRTFAGIVGGTVLLMLLGGALRTAAVVQVNALSERFARATAQLGSDHLVERLAGVHTLEAIAGAERDLRRPVYETLLAFVHERARNETGADSLLPAPDLVAAVTVLSRRESDDGAVPLRPDFSGANLRGARLDGAQWDFAQLRGTHLEGASLRGARIAGKFGADRRGIHLDSADLSLAHLDGARLTEGAVLMHANLKGTDLDGANLQGADLRAARLDSAGLAGAQLNAARLDSASLRGADLQGATLTGAAVAGTDFAGALMQHANLTGADLRSARNLTVKQLAGARIDDTTLLLAGMARPAAPPPSRLPHMLQRTGPPGPARPHPGRPVTGEVLDAQSRRLAR